MQRRNLEFCSWHLPLAASQKIVGKETIKGEEGVEALCEVVEGVEAATVMQQ